MPSRFRRFGTSLLVVFLGATALPGASAQEAPPASDAAVPAEESPLLVEPQTPDELFRAADLMTRLARFGLARRYLEKFVAANPDDETLLAIRDRYGAAAFLRMAKIPQLAPVAQPLLERINTLLQQRDADPARLDALVDDLLGTVRQRTTALEVARNIGAPVVPRILKRIGALPPDARRDLLIDALVQMGADAVPPLLGALDAPSVNVQSAAIEALGRIGTPEAVPYLWSPAYGADQPPAIRVAARAALARIYQLNDRALETLTPYGAAAELLTQARRHLAYEYPWGTDADRMVRAWTWSPQAETVELVRLTPETASLYTGTKLARQALGLSPENAAAQSLYFALALAGEWQRAGLAGAQPTGPGTVHNLALTAGADVMQRALQAALDARNEAAAIAALRVLGQIATRNVLNNQPGSPSALLAALNYPDADVQFAAANAVMQLDPVESFPQSSRVVEILSRALVDSGAPVVLVIDPNVQRASTIGGMLAEAGLLAETAATGRQGFLLAADRADIELIAVHANVIQWPLSATIANLRADARTAGIPIVIYGPDTLRDDLAPLLARTDRIGFIAEPSTADFLRAQLAAFEHLIEPPPTPEQRNERQALAAYWLARIADGHRAPVFPLVPAEDELGQAVGNPNLARNAIAALGGITTPTAQRKLQEVAVSPQFTPEIREVAALQLAFHIQRFGLLLPTAQVAELYQAWQMAPTPQVATALASVVGSLKPNTKLVTERIQSFPPPPVPAP